MSSRSADFSRLADRSRPVKPRTCDGGCGEQAAYETPDGEIVCPNCVMGAIRGDETVGDCRELTSSERWVTDTDAMGESP